MSYEEHYYTFYNIKNVNTNPQAASVEFSWEVIGFIILGKAVGAIVEAIPAAKTVDIISFSKQGNNLFKATSKLFQIGIRMDKPHAGHLAKGLLDFVKRTCPHIHFWSW